MSRAFIFSVALVTTIGMLINTAGAVPVTGGTGPGGILTNDGTSPLEFWADAENSTFTFVSGSTVNSWGDQSGNGRTATRSGNFTTVTRNAGALNGQATVSFALAGSTDHLSFSTATLNTTAGTGTGATAIVVHNATGTGGNDTLFSNNSANRQFFRQNGNNYVFYNGSNPDPNVSSTQTNGVGQTSFAVRSVEFLDGANPDIAFWNNGIALNVSNANNHNPGGWALNTFGGDGGGCCGPLQGDVAEAILIDRRLNNAERVIVENYLSSKYNLGSTASGPNNTLGVNDHYSGDLAANGNFDLQVFGVGQAADASQATNAGAAGFGIEVTGGLDNGEYIMAGHNTPTNAITDGSWDRVWFLDTNDNDVDLSLAFDFSDAGLGAPSESEYALLFSATDPNTLDQIATANLVGDVVTFDFASGDLQTGFYTLGSAQVVPEPASIALWSVLGLGLANYVRRRRKVQK